MKDKVVDLLKKVKQYIGHRMITFPFFSGFFGLLAVLWAYVLIRDYAGRSIPPWESIYVVKNEFFEVVGKVLLFSALFAVAFYLERRTLVKFDDSGITYKKKKYAWSEIGYVKEVYIRTLKGSYQYVVVDVKGEAIVVYNRTFLGRTQFEDYLLKNNIGTTYHR